MRQRPAGGERATWKSGWRNHRGKGVTGGNVCALRTQAGVTGGGRGTEASRDFSLSSASAPL